jgi:hypothetical protein
MIDINPRETKIFSFTYRDKENKEAVIEFTVTQLNAASGIKYMKKVQKLVLPVWAEAQRAGEKSADGEEGAGVSFSDLMIKLSEKLDELDEKDIVDLVCESLNYTPTKFNDVFRGKYFVLIQLVKDIIMFNFKDVFMALGLEEV